METQPLHSRAVRKLKVFLVFSIIGYTFYIGYHIAMDKWLEAHVWIDIVLLAVLVAFTVMAGLYTVFAREELRRNSKHVFTEKDLLAKRPMSEQELVKILRFQRHDFLNYLQVLYGLLQMGKLERAQQYIQEINEEMQNIAMVMRFSIPEISLLLVNKFYFWAGQQVRLIFDIHTRLEGLTLRAEPCVSLLEQFLNIILQGIAASEKSEQDAYLRISEDSSCYLFELTVERPAEAARLNQEMKNLETWARAQRMDVAIVQQTMDDMSCWVLSVKRGNFAVNDVNHDFAKQMSVS